MGLRSAAWRRGREGWFDLVALGGSEVISDYYHIWTVIITIYEQCESYLVALGGSEVECGSGVVVGTVDLKPLGQEALELGGVSLIGSVEELGHVLVDRVDGGLPWYGQGTTHMHRVR